MFRRRWRAAMAFAVIAIPLMTMFGAAGAVEHGPLSQTGCLSTTTNAAAKPPGVQKMVQSNPRVLPIGDQAMNRTPRITSFSANSPESHGANAAVSVSVTCGDPAFSMATSAPAPAAAGSAVALALPSESKSVTELFLRSDLLMWPLCLAALFGVGALSLVLLAAWQAAKHGGFRLTSYWGGFGGSGTGWHTSPAAASLLCAALLGCSAALIVMGLLQSVDWREQVKPAASGASAVSKQ
jgi:hypothetical protein